MASPHKIVFNVPSLVPEGPQPTDLVTPRSATASAAAHDGDERKLATLMEVGEAFASTLNLQAGLYGALEVLERRCGAVRGAVALLDAETGLLTVEAALGHAQAAGGIRYRLGEGVPGRVAQSGEPIMVPGATVQEEAADQVTVLCVPILLRAGVAGTLAAEMLHDPARDWERMMKVLAIAAGMISQALRVHHLVGQDRERLLEENTQLRQELQQRYEFTNIIGNSGPMRGCTSRSRKWWARPRRC